MLTNFNAYYPYFSFLKQLLFLPHFQQEPCDEQNRFLESGTSEWYYLPVGKDRRCDNLYRFTCSQKFASWRRDK